MAKNPLWKFDRRVGWKIIYFTGKGKKKGKKAIFNMRSGKWWEYDSRKDPNAESVNLRYNFFSNKR